MPDERSPRDAHPALILRNAFNGETFRFDEACEDVDSTSFDVLLDRGGSGGGNALRHVHPVARETFTVQSGRLAVVVDGATTIAGPGQSVSVPPGTAHHFRNAGEEVAVFTVCFEPAQQHREFFQSFGRLVERKPQWFSPKGDPDFLLVALVLHTYRDHLYLSGPPVLLQKILFAILAPIARLAGYRIEDVPAMTALSGSSEARKGLAPSR